MPLFEYECKKCGENFEELVRADTRVKCPKCGAGKVERKLSTFACSSGASTPCESGTCPTSADNPGSCATGCCPFS